MANQFTVIIERDGDWFIACCPEVPGADGQGRTKAEALLEDRWEDALRGLPPDAERETITIE